MTFLAAIGWPTAVIVISIVAFLTIVASIAIWQVFATGRRAIGNEGAAEYRRLAEDLAAMQRDTTVELQKANEALAQLREQTRQLETGLKELDRILKAVE
jgi:RNA-splicing ligase RtcB